MSTDNLRDDQNIIRAAREAALFFNCEGSLLSLCQNPLHGMFYKFR